MSKTKLLILITISTQTSFIKHLHLSHCSGQRSCESYSPRCVLVSMPMLKFVRTSCWRYSQNTSRIQSLLICQLLLDCCELLSPHNWSPRLSPSFPFLRFFYSPFRSSLPCSKLTKAPHFTKRNSQSPGSLLPPGLQLLTTFPLLTSLDPYQPLCLSADAGDTRQTSTSALVLPFTGKLFCKLLLADCHNIFNFMHKWHLLNKI